MGGSELTAQGELAPGARNPGARGRGRAGGLLSRVFRSSMRWLGTYGTYLPWASNRSRCSCYICQPPRLAWPSPEDAPSPWSLWVLFPCLAAALLSFFPPTRRVEDICSCLVFLDQGSATHSLTAARPVFAEQSHSFFHPLCLSSSSPSHHHLHPHHSLQSTCLLPVDDFYSIPPSETTANAVTTGEAPQHAHVAGGCRPGICHRPPRRLSRRLRRWRDRWHLGTSASGCRREWRQERPQALEWNKHWPGPLQEGLFRPPIWISALRDFVLVK